MSVEPKTNNLEDKIRNSKLISQKEKANETLIEGVIEWHTNLILYGRKVYVDKYMPRIGNGLDSPSYPDTFDYNSTEQMMNKANNKMAELLISLGHTDVKKAMATFDKAYEENVGHLPRQKSLKVDPSWSNDKWMEEYLLVVRSNEPDYVGVNKGRYELREAISRKLVEQATYTD